MKRILFILLSCLAFGFQATAQTDLQGRWYMFSRNRVIRFTITRDSLLSDQLDWDLSLLQPSRTADTSIIVKRFIAHHNQYFFLLQPHDSTHYIHLATFVVITPTREISLAVNSPDSGYLDVIQAQQYISSDTSQKYGVSLFSNDALRSLQQQKSISAMTSSDFKRYAAKIITFHLQLDSLSQLPSPPNGLVYYAYSMIRTALGQVGFNPLVSNNQLENAFRHFEDDPETKELYHQIFH
jgi:hypothetical protein